jgi:interferon-induced GTP-binding protein Mx1
MDQLFSKEVRPLLDLVDTLREIGIQREISLPQIAVMGDQSSGKSSVLEAISGIPFPRGSGLVTRCPTELIMSKSAAGSAWHGELSVKWSHSHQPPECGVLKSIDEVPAKLSRLADILTNDKSNGFTNDSIILRITSPDSPDLTIIDLPGIVRTSTSGQTSNVIEQVNDLITSYISLPNTIILAVVPCNQDIATVDILERASHYDKEGGYSVCGVICGLGSV